MTSLTRERAANAWRAAFRAAGTHVMLFASLSHEAHAGALLLESGGNVGRAIAACDVRMSFGQGARAVLERIAAEESEVASC